MWVANWRTLTVVTALALWLLCAAPSGLAGRVPCSTVLSRVTHSVGQEKGRPVDMSQLAKRLGTTVTWVEHCMRVYGRRPKRPGFESAEEREAALEALEEDEPEETSSEDVQEPGARERAEHPARERVLRIKPPPTPDSYGRQREE